MPRQIALLILTACLAFAVRTPRPLPNVAISTPNGKTIDLKKYQGKVVMLALISTTCSDCIAAIDMMNKMQKSLGPRGFQSVAVAVGLDADKNTKGFIERYRPEFPMGYVLETPFRELADIDATSRPYVPVFLFIDRKGIIRFQYTAIDSIMEKSQRSKNSNSIVDGLLRQ